MTLETSDQMVEVRALLVDLQTRIAFQEDTLQELNQALVDQQRQLERLAQRCLSLEQSNTELAAALDQQQPPDERSPPHY